jgi:hypothetical protein
MSQPASVTGYRCTTHNFSCTGKAALQLHMNGTVRDCHIDVLRADPSPADSTLTLDQKLSAIRLYFCADHYPGGVGNKHTCPVCVRDNIGRRHGASAPMSGLIAVHLTESAGDSICGKSRPYVGTSERRRVTCPDCLIVDYTSAPGNDPLDSWTPPPPSPKPEPAEPPHVGPHWEHDCETCIYLGTRYGSGRQWDLYFCPPNKFNERGNVIARRGPLGDYVSGMGFVDREPMLAVAAILAMKAGHLTYADVVTTRNN